ncbi:MAG: hypothetical protein Fur0015_08760 [Ignavibacteriales bacterium]
MQKFLTFVEELETKLSDLSRQANIAYFNATISGDKNDYAKASDLQLAVSKIFADKNDFVKLKSFKHEIPEDEHVLNRIYKILFNEFAGNQFDEKLHTEIINLSTKIEEKFATYRAKVNGQILTDNQIDEILKTSNNNDELKSVWEASKQIAEEIHEDVVKLVKLRNESAKLIGFNNYHQMSIELNEQNQEELLILFDELDELTREKFIGLKNIIDENLSEKYQISPAELMPWHYQNKFFQEAPKIYSVDYDKYFFNRDVVRITSDYFNGINLSADDIITNSDLFEKENKYQHAYCMNIDRSGDVRIVCNIKPNHKWMSTMLHETGHAVYDKYISPQLPWILRSHAHIFATEAIAMMFGRMPSKAEWLRDVIRVEESEVKKIKNDSEKSLALEQLIFSRWVQVVFRFEKAMYENPDQDLDNLWWNLVEKYQMIKKPSGRNKPDWASKIHIALYPVYYHNYMLGELLASQLYNYISKKVLMSNEHSQSFAGQKDVGEYLKNLFFGYGAFYNWNDLIFKATGEKLSPKYYAEEFCR